MLRALRHLLLAAALLAAWHGALVHPIAHSHAQGGLVHLAGVPQGSGDGENGRTALCDAIGALAACIPGADSDVSAAPRGADGVILSRAEAPLPASPPVYHSQAPPSLL